MRSTVLNGFFFASKTIACRLVLYKVSIGFWSSIFCFSFRFKLWILVDTGSVCGEWALCCEKFCLRTDHYLLYTVSLSFWRSMILSGSSLPKLGFFNISILSSSGFACICYSFSILFCFNRLRSSYRWWIGGLLPAKYLEFLLIVGLDLSSDSILLW